MSENIIQQETLLRSVRRALENFKKFGQQNYTPAKIRARIISLKETWNKCITDQAVILTTYSKEQRAILDYFKTDKLEEHEEDYQIALDFMQEWLEQLEPPVSPIQSRSVDNSFSRTENALSLNHLPPIKLPPFAGNFAEWESFRDRFTALIIENKDLSDFSRMHFLASSLSSSAREVISSIAITADNFSVAWKSLKARFENKNKLIDLHVAALYNLPSMSRESADELHALRDTTDRSIEALKCLGRSTEQILSDILVYFVARKLDPSTRRAWKLKSSIESDPLSFEDLTKFLSSRAIALDDLIPLNPKPIRNVKANNATASDTSAPTCSLCKKQHYFSKCVQFLNKSPSQRREIVKRCFNCLSLKHSVQECTSKFSCRKSQKRHHSSLHLDSNSDSASIASSANTIANTTNESVNQPATTSPPSHAVTLSSISGKAGPSPVLLATARVIIESPTGRRIPVRALLDQGSEVTFIKENIVQTLRLRRTRTLTTISAVGCANVGTCRNMTLIKISPRNKSAPTFSTFAFIMPSLTKYHPHPMQSVDDWDHLRDLQLADDDPTGSVPIELILGADLYGRLLLDDIRKGPDGNPIAQNSHLGWIISGPVAAKFISSHAVNVFHCSLETEIKRFWELEEPLSERILSPEEQKCEEYFRMTHSRCPDGNYTVRLPFKRGPPIEIGESRSTALRQLTSLKRRLDLNLNLKKEYFDFLREYETLGHMKQVDPPTSGDTQIVYIPHHAVIRESSSTTKVRVVFNASSLSSNNTSLNSHLHIGSKLQTDLTAVLLRWRQYKYVYSADIAKMYRQIYVDNQDRDYQRILWHDAESNEIRDYQLLTVTYGTACAPYLALRTIQQLLLDDGSHFPLAIPILQDNIYVDDVLFGADDIPLIRRSREQVCALLANGGFTLRKWASNKAELLQDISSEDYGLACHTNFQLDDRLNILGTVWNPALDSFQYQVSLAESVPTTKCAILSAIAKLFDPLGWVTPVTVTVKIFMQNLWHLKFYWDDPVPSSVLTRWENIYRNLSHLNGLKVPRWTGRGSDTLRVELHDFADASTVAYAAAVYISVTSISNEITITLLTAKSKVAPIKTMSIPRLELCAAALLARVMQSVRVFLSINTVTAYCWTDSTIVLAWLKAHPSRWKTFVSNRVADIQNRIPEAKWSYVSTHENPADCASRGFLGNELNEFSLWQGPPWLRANKRAWPCQNQSHELTVNEEAKPFIVHLTQSTDSWDLALRFSSWHKLLRVTAYIRRFVNNCRRETSNTDSPLNSRALTATECKQAQIYWIQTIQAEKFTVEVSALQKGHPLPSKTALAKLSPFLDDNNIIRVGGRLAHAPLSFGKRNPVLLSPHPVVNLIVQYAHLKSCHAGVQLTLATLRHDYWILRARNIAKQIIHQCVTCTRERAAVPEQLMGQFPPARVSAPGRAFLHCGVDYAGPVATRISPGRGHKTTKGYIALFVCLASRAIHLELVSNCSTSAFLNAFSRFCTRTTAQPLSVQTKK